jgi:hypothetical protein
MDMTEMNAERADAIEELGQVMNAACWAVTQAMIEGAEAGYAGKWMEQSSSEHLDHAFNHLSNTESKEMSGEELEMHLTHAICRIAMALIRLEDEKTEKI